MRALRAAAGSRPASLLLLCCFFWIVAAAAHAGFIGKWGFRDSLAPKRFSELAAGAPDTASHDYSIEALLDGDAARPFAYRQLLPLAANLADRATPGTLKAWLADHVLTRASPARVFVRAASADRPDYQFRYAVLYALSFASMFFALFALRQVLLDLGYGPAPATVAPAAFLLAFPYFETLGGYVYDNPELLFLSLAVLLALRGRVLLLLAVTLLGTFNKETFLFFVPALFPLLYALQGRRRAVLATACCLAVAAAVNVAVKLWFSHVPGGVAEWHLAENIRAYLNPLSYLGLEVTYGLPGPSKLSLGTALAIAVVALRAWPLIARPVRQHLGLAALVNVPLFVLFGWAGEIRNLSLLFVGLVILIAAALERSWAAERLPRPQPARRRTDIAASV